MQAQSLTPPLILTLTRLILSPILVPILLLTYLPAYPDYSLLFAAAILLLSLTDFFDGYLARKYQQESLLGKLLDPVADKFLMISVIISLVYLQLLSPWWAIIVLCRDMFVMGLREIALHSGFSVPVTWAGKLKTVLQIAYVVTLIARFGATDSCCTLGATLEELLWISSLIITFYSGYSYYIDYRRAAQVKI